MSLGDRDPALRRFERDAVAICLGTALLALVVTAIARGAASGLNAAASVLGGGLLMAISYRAIKGGVDVLSAIATQAGPRRGTIGEATAEAVPKPHPPADTTEAEPGPAGLQPSEEAPVLSPGRRILLVVKFFTRYALLAVAAYVMLTCFRLHPVGLVAGALAPFLAGVMQVGRLSRARARRQLP